MRYACGNDQGIFHTKREKSIITTDLQPTFGRLGRLEEHSILVIKTKFPRKMFFL